MQSLGQKGAIQFIALLILLAGLVGGVYLVTRTEPFKFLPRAASEPISGPIPTSIPIPTPTPTPTPVPTPIPTTPPDIQPPQVLITYPLDASTVRKNNPVNIVATASDNVAVDRVEFYVNDVLICTDFTSEYSCLWNVPKKPRLNYSLTVKALDNSSNSASQIVTVTSK